MYVNEIWLKNFRNYENGHVKFTKGTNVIYGDNARGKTNILEAIYLCATARSHRLATNMEMIMNGQDSARIKASFYSHDRENDCEIKLFSDKKKQIKVNSIPVQKTSDLMGNLNVVMFCPEDLQIVKGSPRVRRRMIDLGLCQIRQKYFHMLAQYNKIVEQKNKLLKSDPQSDMLSVWNESMIAHGSVIIWYRSNYIKKIAQFSKKIHDEICGETLEIEYLCGVGNINDFTDQNEIKEKFKSEIDKNAEREKRFGSSLVGPHRDDFSIKINGSDAREYASQGQQRTAALALKMSEISIIEKDSETPVLLLDDVLSELDESRQKYILNNIKDMQVIITYCEKEKFENSIIKANMIDVEGVKN